MSEEQIRANRAYNKRIARYRHMIYVALERIALISAIVAIICPVYKVCVCLMLVCAICVYMANGFCDD